MQPHELRRHDNEDVLQAGPNSPCKPARPAVSAMLTTLAIPALVKMLAKRIVASVIGADLLGAFLQIRSRALNHVTSITVSSARAAAAAKARGFQNRIAVMLRNGRSALSKLSPSRRRILTFVAVVAFVPATYVAYCIVTIPLAGGVPIQRAPSAMIFEAENGRPVATRGILKGQNISADRIPPLLAGAVTAIEDRRFYQHNGVDFRAMTRAAWHDLTGRRLEGGSTITQQLARRLYLSPKRSVRRKVQEAALAMWLELRFSKNEILARYLNTTY
ncbi:MAG: biosynthetic peptidoglycan transglycosylase, partial [Pseudolabrys sp.]